MTTTDCPCVISEKQITVYLPTGKVFAVKAADPNYPVVLEAIKAKDWDAVVDMADLAAKVNAHAKGAFVVEGDVVKIGGEVLPESLSKRLIAFTKQGIDVDPLVKFWANLQNNPSYRSVQQLHAFLEANDHPITPDGCFIGYRAISNDWKDLRTNTMDNSIGAVVEMPRNKVDEDPERTCSSGLHVASYNYAQNHYGAWNGSHRLVAVKVNPADVVAVPTDYNGEKMRVCKFEVLSEIEKEIKEQVYDPYTPDEENDEFNPYDDEDEECDGCCDCCECQAE